MNHLHGSVTVYSKSAAVRVCFNGKIANGPLKKGKGGGGEGEGGASTLSCHIFSNLFADR